MTVPAAPTKITYNGNGIQVTWDITFNYIASTDIVLILTSAAGVETTVVANYSVDTVLNKVTYPTTASALPPIATGTKITLKRTEPLSQELDLQNGAPFNLDDIERSFDKTTMTLQQLQDQIDRAPKQVDSVAATNLIMPTPVTGKVIGWDATGQLANIDPATSTGLGTMSTQNAAAVAITGGTITGITDLAIADGGTGASTAQTALNNLTGAAAAVDETVLTKDTATGNAIFKAAPTGIFANSGAVDRQVSLTNALVTGDTAAIGGAKVTHKGVADQIQVVVQGHSTQTGNILEVRKSDSTVQLGVSNTAGMTVGGTTSQIKDPNANELIKFDVTAAAVNEITVKNNSTGAFPRISATGETNVALELAGKGTKGIVHVNAVLDAAVALADGATPALDASLGNKFRLAAAGNRTIAVPSNPPTTGYTQKIVIEHFASGGARTLALNSGAGGFRFGSDITALTATASGKTDYIGCIWNITDSFWDVVAVIKGF